MIFATFYGAFVLLPFLAPVLMQLHLQGMGKLVYLIYGFVCHQLPERSLFILGPKMMYSLGEIGEVWPNTQDPLMLRQFIGNAEMGWKVAWSDRMISTYGGIWVFGLLWSLLRKWSRTINVWVLTILTLPLVLDGTTHFLSDLYGLSKGFRFTNDWLVMLTKGAFPVSFYVGDGLGSFNSWMRWLTGLFFSFGLVWWSFPFIDQSLSQSAPGFSRN